MLVRCWLEESQDSLSLTLQAETIQEILVELQKSRMLIGLWRIKSVPMMSNGKNDSGKLDKRPCVLHFDKNLVCLCPRTLCEAGFKNSRLMNLVKYISSWLQIQAVSWLLLGAFQPGLWYEREAEAYQGKIHDCSTRKRRIYKVESKEGVVSQEDCGHQKEAQYFTLRQQEGCIESIQGMGQIHTSFSVSQV